MPRAPLLTAVAALALAPACAEDSSFVLRWQVGRTEADAERPLASIRQCSELGLSYVRVTTVDSDQEIVDTRDFPCFPDEFAAPDGAAPGPELGAGVYSVSVVGLTRRAQTRPDPADADLLLARDSATVTVETKGEGRLVSSFRLVGIDECHDGVDNDRDGAVDLADAPCRDGQVREDLDLSGALFTFRATLLGGDNPHVTCAGLDLEAFRVTLDGDVAGARTIPCTTTPQSFSADLPAGEHTWAVEGIGRDGDVVTQAFTGADSFVVAGTGFTLVPIEVDFAIASFLAQPAFSGPLSFSIEYAPYPGAPLNRPCDPSGYDNVGDLVLGTARVTLLADGEPAAEVTLGDAPFPITDACSFFDAIRTIPELAWSGDPALGAASYSLQVEAWAEGEGPGDEPCFSNASREDADVRPEPLAPNISISVAVPRLRSDGACAECVEGKKNDNCQLCEAGVCKRTNSP